MSTKPKILVQLDTDPQPSVFDAVVAIDAGAEHLFRHGGVTPEKVPGLVHGALFTRGFDDLRHSALFLGGSDVTAAEALLDAVKKTFFGPFRVSVLLDPNGSNTTAAAAVLAAIKGAGGSLAGHRVAVLGGTGPVGQRVARLCAREGASVALGSRSLSKAQAAAETISKTTGAPIAAFASEGESTLLAGLEGAQVIVAAGAAGVTLLPLSIRHQLPELKALIDLNAVPPLGIEGVEANDRDTPRENVRAWGALGVGGTKMKIHKQAIRRLFESNDAVLDAEECLKIGRERTT